MFRYPAELSDFAMGVQPAPGKGVTGAGGFQLQNDLAAVNGPLVGAPHGVQRFGIEQTANNDVAIAYPMTALIGFFAGNFSRGQVSGNIFDRIGAIKPGVGA